jgi:hypothetical protein
MFPSIKIKSAIGLRRFLDKIYKGGVKYYKDGQDTIFTYQQKDGWKEVARFDYDNSKAILLDKKIID